MQQTRWCLGWILLTALAAPAAALAVTEVPCANGIAVRIHDAPEVAARYVTATGGTVRFVHEAAGGFELLTGPDDPRLRRQGVQRFQPYAVEPVIAALAAMQGITPVIEVEVFILPAPPVAPQSSFARKGFVFLSPGFGPVPASTLAYTVTHEMGHVLTWGYLDAHPERWLAYQQLRGISGPATGHDVPHADRAREILAEDIRYLFGGSLATASGTIENHDLPLPDQVAGLADLLAGYIDGLPQAGTATGRSLAFPNPCNPTTTIELMLPAGQSGDGEAILTIYDLRGRLLRRITGGRISGGTVRLSWDGRDDTGRLAATGQYLYRITCGPAAGSGSVLLVK